MTSDTHALVLAAMTGERWRMTGEIADDTDLPVTVVRLVLHELRQQGLVWRSIRGEWLPSASVESVRRRQR